MLKNAPESTARIAGLPLILTRISACMSFMVTGMAG